MRKLQFLQQFEQQHDELGRLQRRIRNDLGSRLHVRRPGL